MGTSDPCGLIVVKDSETVLPPVPLLSHLLLIHNVLLLGGIPQIFLEQHKLVQCIPTAFLSFGYGAREKPNDLSNSQAETRTGVPGSTPRRPSPFIWGVRAPGLGLRSPPPPPEVRGGEHI